MKSFLKNQRVIMNYNFILKVFTYIIISMAIGSFTFMMLVLYDKKFNNEEISFSEYPQFNIQDTSIISVNDVYSYLNEIHVKFPRIVTSQSVLETTWYKCNNCSMDVGNIFGFFLHKEFMPFKNWKESCQYYKWWQDQLYKGGDYYEFLEEIGYATDSLYNKKLKQIERIIFQ